jgi:hypothetical protein
LTDEGKKMKLVKSALLLLASLLSGVLATSVFADHDRLNVNYQLVVQDSNALSYVAHELKNELQQLRGLPGYGRMQTLVTKIKTHAHRLYTFGSAGTTCNWESEIALLDQLACELTDLVDNALQVRPCNGSAIRHLVSKIAYHVKSLDAAIHYIGIGVSRRYIGASSAAGFGPFGFANSGYGYNQGWPGSGLTFPGDQAQWNRGYGYGSNRTCPSDRNRQSYAVNANGLYYPVNK